MSTPNILRYIDIYDQYWICLDCHVKRKPAAELLALGLTDVINTLRLKSADSWKTFPLDSTDWQKELSALTDAWKVSFTSRHFVEITHALDADNKITIHQSYRTATLTR